MILTIPLISSGFQATTPGSTILSLTDALRAAINDCPLVYWTWGDQEDKEETIAFIKRVEGENFNECGVLTVSGPAYLELILEINKRINELCGEYVEFGPAKGDVTRWEYQLSEAGREAYEQSGKGYISADDAAAYDKSEGDFFLTQDGNGNVCLKDWQWRTVAKF